MRHFMLLFLLTTVSCGSLRKMAVRSTSPLMVEGSNKLTNERSWEFFKESAPGNLKFAEMLYLQDRENLKLLSVLVKGFAGLAFAVPETLAYQDELEGVDSSSYKKEALGLYTRALDYGLEYLSRKKIGRQDLLSKEESKLRKLLNDEIDKEDYPVVLYFAQSWGSLMNLQKENVAMVALVPRVKILFDWVCEKDPEIEHGVCDIFYAQYEASRPRMLGGNPEKARKLYEAAIKKRPLHLLIRVSMLQQMIVPAFDSEAYEFQAKILREEFAKWEDLNRDTLEVKSEYHAVEHLNLYNAMAKKRFEIIEKNKNKIFEG